MKKEKLLFSTDIDIMFPDDEENKAMYHDFCAINEIEPSEDDMYEYLASEIDWMLGDLLRASTRRKILCRACRLRTLEWQI